MTSYIVSYDLHAEGQNYECLYKKLDAYSTRWHVQRSVWVIVTNETAKDIRNNLVSCLDSNDKLLVAKLSGEAAWHGYDQKIANWIKQNL